MAGWNGIDPDTGEAILQNDDGTFELVPMSAAQELGFQMVEPNQSFPDPMQSFRDESIDYSRMLSPFADAARGVAGGLSGIGSSMADFAGSWGGPGPAAGGAPGLPSQGPGLQPA